MIKSNFLRFGRLKKKAYKIKPTCIICGKKFVVKINRDGFIETDCFHSYLRKHYFLGWTYELLSDRNEENFLDNFKLRFKNKFYRIVGFSKVSREIIYFIWSLFYGWQKIPYWECKKCANRPDDI